MLPVHRSLSLLLLVVVVFFVLRPLLFRGVVGGDVEVVEVSVFVDDGIEVVVVVDGGVH